MRVEFYNFRKDPFELIGTVTLEQVPVPHLVVVTELQWVREQTVRPHWDVQPAPTPEYLVAMAAAYASGTGYQTLLVDGPEPGPKETPDAA